jgi:hypothetical protein
LTRTVDTDLVRPTNRILVRQCAATGVVRVRIVRVGIVRVGIVRVGIVRVGVVRVGVVRVRVVRVRVVRVRVVCVRVIRVAIERRWDTNIGLARKSSGANVVRAWIQTRLRIPDTGPHFSIWAKTLAIV